jgi:NitT/TauT family transport system substrate-binding protein
MASQSRRTFVQGSFALAGVALLSGCGTAGPRTGPSLGGSTLETTRIRLTRFPSLCVAPQYVAEDLLRAEGFTDVQYVRAEGGLGVYQTLTAGEADISLGFVGPAIIQLDASQSIVLLAGVHVGCFEVFGGDRVQAIRDLKGKDVAVIELGGSHHIFLSSIMAHVGLDPRSDVNWMIHPGPEAMSLLAEGKVDAYLGFPPDPQELRSRKVGHVILNSAVDKPWSQYFCCLAMGNREFVTKNPEATRRTLRAIMKAADICATEPDRAAQLVVDRGFAPRLDYALQTLKDLPYNRWREFDPEDTVRYYALRLHEAGMVKGSPETLVGRSADWRFLNELKRELKT